SQLIGKSAVIEGLLAWMIDQAPCSALAIHPTTQNAINWSKNKFSPLLDSIERLRRLVNQGRPQKQRGSGENTICWKKFPGGWILAGGSGSPANLRAHTCKWCVFDETDAYKDSAGDDGDVISLV